MIGAVLVLIILFLFLLNFRTTFITLTAIPLSLVITTLVFRALGYFSGTQLSINVMTLGGIAMALRTSADWVVRPRLLKIAGVAEVFIQGGDRKQYQILVNPAALLEYDVTLQQV